MYELINIIYMNFILKFKKYSFIYILFVVKNNSVLSKIKVLNKFFIITIGFAMNIINIFTLFY